MNDLISRSEIVKVAEKAYDAWNLAMATADGQREINLCFKRQDLCKAVKAVAKAAPTVDAEPVTHAHWELMQEFPFCDEYACTRCGRSISLSPGEHLQDYPYCHCGAKMDGRNG